MTPEYETFFKCEVCGRYDKTRLSCEKCGKAVCLACIVKSSTYRSLCSSCLQTLTPIQAEIMAETEAKQTQNSKIGLGLFIISFAWLVPIVLMPTWFQGYSPIVILLDIACIAGMGFLWWVAMKYGKKATPPLEKMREPG